VCKTILIFTDFRFTKHALTGRIHKRRVMDDGSRQLIDFDRAEVVLLKTFPPNTELNVSGIRPQENMEIHLEPRRHDRLPEYWDIEVAGVLREAAQDPPASYEVSILLDGTSGLVGIDSVIGTEGIEVIGAARSEKVQVPLIRTGDCGNWIALHRRERGSAPLLFVSGKCDIPAPLTVLKRRPLQGPNSKNLLLDRGVNHVELVAGSGAGGTRAVLVNYSEETDEEYDTVTILPDDVSIPVKDVDGAGFLQILLRRSLENLKLDQ
jgi:hypothetical protein